MKDNAASELIKHIGKLSIAEKKNIITYYHGDISNWRPLVDNLVEYGQNGDIVGYFGMTKRKSNHKVILSTGRIFYTWCVWDAYFILLVLESEGVIESFNPQTKEYINIIFDSNKFISSKNIYMSIPKFGLNFGKKTLKCEFCCRVFLWSSSEEANIYAEENNCCILNYLDIIRLAHDMRKVLI